MVQRLISANCLSKRKINNVILQSEWQNQRAVANYLLFDPEQPLLYIKMWSQINRYEQILPCSDLASTEPHRFPLHNKWVKPAVCLLLLCTAHTATGSPTPVLPALQFSL